MYSAVHTATSEMASIILWMQHFSVIQTLQLQIHVSCTSLTNYLRASRAVFFVFFTETTIISNNFWNIAIHDASLLVAMPLAAFSHPICTYLGQ